VTVKLVFCLRRRDGMSQEEFLAYWLEKHGPLVRSHAETLRIRRYVQLHPLEGSAAADALRGVRHGPEPFDGVAELWFDSEEDIAAAARSDAARTAATALLEDERRFIALERSPIWLHAEHVLVP
jgi:uncharacterized protein (TIGR02118 family)